MSRFGGSSLKCPKCDSAIYAVEQVIGPGNKYYHKNCLCCVTCNKRVETFSLLEHDEQPYCKTCHSKQFGSRITTPRSSLGGTGSSQSSSPSRWGGGGVKCAKCEKTVYAAEQLNALSKTWHKGCLRCSECDVGVDPGRLNEHDGAPLCGKCYNKLYGTGGLARA
ncbi:hypothetical protein C8J56DRAFT_940840 [Mycena floridula]|nr:hypothetical protein C8J56DRAFT_940840 [Mycena floridula]